MYRLLHTALLFAAVALSVHLATAQEQSAVSGGGIQFEHELSWAGIRAKAKAEHKYIFLDCFTTWCGPCRYMRTSVFPEPLMGDYFNDKFISAEVQLDSTAKDDGRVRSWYADAHALMVQYKIAAFPTYLVFTPEGQVVHRMVGSTTAEKFVAEVRNSFDSTQQYYTQLREFEAGRRDSGFLRRLTYIAFDLYDLDDARKFAKAYFSTQTDLLTPGNIDIIQASTLHSGDEYFSFLVQHRAEIDKLKGQGKAEKQVREIVLREGTGIRRNDNRQPKWDSLQKAIAARVPYADAAEWVGRLKVNFYLGRSDWPHFEAAMRAYMKAYSKEMSDEDLNSVAWSVFEGCPDLSCVTNVLDWSKQLKDAKDPAFMDTYANLLYKLGKKDDAIALEEKAVRLLPFDASADYRSNLDKMKKGEKTWN